jgi:hypothetical protein
MRSRAISAEDMSSIGVPMALKKIKSPLFTENMLAVVLKDTKSQALTILMCPFSIHGPRGFSIRKVK